MRFRVLFVITILLSGVLSAQEGDKPFIEQRSAALASPTTPGDGKTPSNTNYVDPFIAALQSFSDSGGEAATFDFNLPKGILGEAFASKLQVALKKPELNAKFVTHLGSDNAAITRFKDDLKLGDDVTVSFSISPQAKSKDEKVRSAFDAYEEPLYNMKSGVVLPQGRRNAILGLDAAADANAVPEGDASPGDNFAFLDSVRAGEITFAADAGGGVRAASAREVLDGVAVVDALFADMGNLAANQSKFNFNASYRKRHETAGPNEWFVKTSYEHGFGTNVEKRIAQKDAACVKTYADLKNNDAGCLNETAAALKEAAESAPVKMGSRLTFALEYHNYSTVNLTAQAFKLPGSKSLVASLNGGFDLLARKEPDANKELVGRVELTAAYDDVSGDKNRKDRLIATLTYSQRITEDFYFPVSLIYANHDDYLSNIDRKLNAHFGISYKLQSKPKKP